MTGDPNHYNVTLLSNASQTLYPAITLRAFTTNLAQPIDLGSTNKWEVCVCEFTYHPFNTGTFASIQVVSASNALIYCELISQQIIVSQ